MKIIKLNDIKDYIQLPFIKPNDGMLLTKMSIDMPINNEYPIEIHISGHNSLGVPTLIDKEVFNALVQIWVKDNTIFDKCLDKLIVTDTASFRVNYISEQNILAHLPSNIGNELTVKDISNSINRLLAAQYAIVEVKGDTKSTKYGFSLLSIPFDFRNNIHKNTDTILNISMNIIESILDNSIYYTDEYSKQIKDIMQRNIYMISLKHSCKGTSKLPLAFYKALIPNTNAKNTIDNYIEDAILALNNYDFIETSIDNEIVTMRYLTDK